jgi:hypothetical protein
MNDMNDKKDKREAHGKKDKREAHGKKDKREAQDQSGIPPGMNS